MLSSASGCRARGTRITEEGRTASTPGRAGVFVHRLDSAAGRALLGLEPTEAVCDASFTFFDEDPLRVVLVELKGGHAARGARQILTTYRAARRLGCVGIEWRGRVVAGASPPGAEWQKFHRQADREGLDLRCCTRKRIDPRND